jgi:hypothetical protein
MTRFSTIHRPTGIVVYGLVALATAITLLLLTQSLLAGIIFLASMAGLGLLYRAGTIAGSRPEVRQLDSRAYTPEEPAVITRITDTAGQERVARVVPLEQSGGHQMVLTAEGYAMVDRSGRVVHRL